MGRIEDKIMRGKIISLAIIGMLGGAAPVLAQNVIAIQQTTIQQTTIIASTATPAAAAYAAPARNDSPKIYAVRNTANYCPSGLQPITINGVICCGTPNQSVSYESMKAHPVTRKVRSRRLAKSSGRVICPVGEKGCYTE